MLVVSVRGLKGDHFVALLGTVGAPAARDVETPPRIRPANSRHLFLYDAIFMKNKIHKKKNPYILDEKLY